MTDGSSPISDWGPFWMPAPGTAYLILNKHHADFSQCSFRLLDLRQQTALPLQPGQLVSATLDPGTRAQLYHLITGDAADMLLQSATANGTFTWRLFAPDLQHTVGGWGEGHFQLHLTPNASYLLLLNGGERAAIPYSIQLKTPSSTNSHLALNTPVSGSLAAGGGEHRFAFEGRAGQTLYYDALQSDSRWAQATLLDPNGRWILSTGSFTDYGPFILASTGTYTLIQSNETFDDLDFSFRLLDGDLQPVLPFDTRVDQMLDAGYLADLYQVQTLQSLPIFFESLDPNADGGWTLLDPLGQQLGANGLYAHFPATPLSSAPHWLVIQNPTPDPMAYSIRAIPGNHPPSLQPIPDLVLDEQTTLEFKVTADDLELPNDSLQFSLASTPPAGATIDPHSGFFRWTPAEDQGPADYAITVQVADDGIPILSDARIFNVAVREVNRPPALSMADQSVHAGGTLQLPLPALDPDLPPNVLTLSLTEGPPNALLDSLNARLTWTSTLDDTGNSYPVILEVTDDGAHPLTSTATFSIAVTDPLRIDSMKLGEGSVTFFWWGIEGHRYRVDFRDDFTSSPWFSLPETIPGAGALTAATDLAPPSNHERYYRVIDLGPTP